MPPSVGQGVDMKVRDVSVLLLAALAGCANTEREAGLIMEPPPVPAGWEGLARADVPDIQNDYVELEPDLAAGALPCALAVARVDATGDPCSEDEASIILAMAPPNELAHWMGLFDDVRFISEIVPVTYPNYPDREVKPDVLLRRAGKLGAGLCLIYRETVYPQVSADVRGAIYEVGAGRMLAVLHADAVAPPQDEEDLPPPPADRVDIDRRHVDPLFVARDCFRSLVRDCVLDWVAKLEAARAERVLPKESTARSGAGNRDGVALGSGGSR